MISASYDRLGRGYALGRRSDPRWQSAIDDALGRAATVVNVGAGSGSYEPRDRYVLAVEPSQIMIDQRSAGAAPTLRVAAEELPIADRQFDAAMAISTLHHWSDWAAGVREMRRVASRVVILHFDPAVHDGFWLVQDYLPELSDVWRETPTPLAVAAELGPEVTIRELPVPWDCEDGFLSAFWRRPSAYLAAEVQACMSGLQVLEPAVLERGMAALASDLQSGAWQRRHAGLSERATFDGGWRLIYN
jgi:SAM-dependent methyltransferase